MVQTLIHRYGEQLRRLLEDGKVRGELDSEIDTEAAPNTPPSSAPRPN
jgi:TetR/AcrR family transcriptional regulator